MSGHSFCERCGAPTSSPQGLCERCVADPVGEEEPDSARVDGTPSTPAAEHHGTELTWIDRSPILGSNVATKQLALVVILAPLIMQLLVGIMGLAVDGEFIVLPLFVYAVDVGVLVVLMVIAVLILGNSMNTEVTVSDAGLGYRMGARPRRLARAAATVGAVTGSAPTAGAGLLATSRESGFFPWRTVTRVRVRQRRRSITLYGDHLPLIEVVCTPELFDNVVAVIERHVRHMDRQS